MSRDFIFDLFRLNVRHEGPPGQQTLPFNGLQQIQSDTDIVKIFSEACHPNFTMPDEVQTATYTWSLTNYAELSGIDSEVGQVIGFQVTRSIVQKVGPTPTDDGKTVVTASDIVPPQSVLAQAIVFLQKHLVAIEYSSEIMQSGKWLDMLHRILTNTSRELGYFSDIQLTVKPNTMEIEKAFHGFDRLTRLSVTLLLPNPEVPDDAKSFFDEMAQGGIKRFKQEMSNPQGLNRAIGKLPHSAISIAQAGYKDGELILEGEVEGVSKLIRTGENPTRGEISEIREFVRGMHAATGDRKVKDTLKRILKEIERITHNEEAS